MNLPTYIDLMEARDVLCDMGIKLDERQIRRAAEPDATGQRKLPFFKDPIDGKLKIERRTLTGIYATLQETALN